MKNILYTITCLFFFHFSFSQNSPAVEWDHTFGGDQDDFYPMIIQTTDSGYLLAGTSTSGISQDKTQSSRGNQDYWIVKTNKKGEKEWDMAFGGSSDDIIQSVINTSDGGFLLGGISFSGISGDKSEPNRGNEDYWVVKTDLLGNKQWDKRFGGNGTDKLYEICQTNDGGYVLGGTSNSGISGDRTQASWGGYDMWIVRIDSNGNKLWDKRYGSGGHDQLISLKGTHDNGLILCGGSPGPIGGDKTSASYGNEDGWIVKIDSAGNKQWDKSFGGSDYDNFTSVQVANDGGFILGGAIFGGSPNYDEYWVVKTDSSGQKLWEKYYGGSSTDMLWHLQKTNDNGAILFGYSDSPVSGSKTEENLDYYQAWIVRIDSTGQQVWDKTILNRLGSGNDFDIPDAIPTLDGGYAVAITTGGGVSGEKTESSHGGADYWLVKLTDKYNTISGNAFYDFNSNQVSDSSDIPADYIQISSNQTNRLAFTSSNGNYSLPVLYSGNYNVIPQNVSYYNSIPYSQSAYFSSIKQTDSLNDFAFQPNGIYNDLSITATPLTRFRPGRDAAYELTYYNVGTTTLSGQVVFIADSNLSFVSSDITPAYLSADSMVWNFSNLTPHQKRKVQVTVHLNDSVTMGTSLVPRGRIEPITGDVTPGSNYIYWEFPVLVTTAVDPNDKTVSKDTLYANQITSNTYLDYRIRFQNTGNDTAFLVKVLDNISPLLDMNTFEIVAVSHPMEIEYRNESRLLIFKFDNILLPDSNVNQIASNGYIHYRIKPLNPGIAAEISNYAAIYFDFNLPVITDTAVTTISMIESTNDFRLSSNDVILYPNPANNRLSIRMSIASPMNSTAVILDILGREIFVKNNLQLTHGTATLDISNLPRGIYFLQLKWDNGSLVKKFVKE